MQKYGWFGRAGKNKLSACGFACRASSSRGLGLCLLSSSALGYAAMPPDKLRPYF